MKYEMVRPPFTLDFPNMSREEARDYLSWFLEQIPIRIRVLEQAVQSTPGHGEWQADCSPESLDRLGRWLYEHVETRKRTKKESKEIYGNAPDWFRSVEIENWELTNRTFSLAMDIGIYLSQVFEKNLSGLKWTMVTKPKNDVDYQRPVLSGTGKLQLNPVRMLVVLAHSLADDTRGPEGLKELYDIWVGLLAG